MQLFVDHAVENEQTLNSTIEKMSDDYEALNADYALLEADYLALCADYDDTLEDYADLNASYNKQKSTITDLNSKLSTAVSNQKQYKDAAEFLYGYIAIIPSGSSTYHSYKCTHFDKYAGFYALNKPTAVLQGYSACKYCGKEFK